MSIQRVIILTVPCFYAIKHPCVDKEWTDDSGVNPIFLHDTQLHVQ